MLQSAFGPQLAFAIGALSVQLAPAPTCSHRPVVVLQLPLRHRALYPAPFADKEQASPRIGRR